MKEEESINASKLTTSDRIAIISAGVKVGKSTLVYDLLNKSIESNDSLIIIDTIVETTMESMKPIVAIKVFEPSGYAFLGEDKKPIDAITNKHKKHGRK